MSTNSVRVVALWRHNLLLWRRDIPSLALLVVMPLLMIAFLQPLYRSTLQAQGFADASGAEQAVPGMTVMFALFGAGIAAFRFFDEHSWGTWERLRAGGVSPVALMAGKLGPPLLVLLGQVALLLAVGVALFGLQIHGTVVGLVAVGWALVVCMLAYAVALTSICRSASQLSAATNVGSIGIAGLGGAVVPPDALPGWAAAIAPATPAYWAMEGFQATTLEAGGLTAVLPAVGMLLAFTVAFTVIAAARFRLTDTKSMS